MSSLSKGIELTIRGPTNLNTSLSKELEEITTQGKSKEL